MYLVVGMSIIVAVAIFHSLFIWGQSIQQFSHWQRCLIRLYNGNRHFSTKTLNWKIEQACCLRRALVGRLDLEIASKCFGSAARIYWNFHFKCQLKVMCGDRHQYIDCGVASLANTFSCISIHLFFLLRLLLPGQFILLKIYARFVSWFCIVFCIVLVCVQVSKTL